MSNSNASPTMFGFDFQVNAAIYLMLENIEKMNEIRLEGKTEDIELFLDDGKRIYAQAKSVVNGSTDFSHVRENLNKALKTLSKADSKETEKLILITNSSNPLNEGKSSNIFCGPPSDVGYNDLPDEAKLIIDRIIEKSDYPIDLNKFRIKYFRFETDCLSERYKFVEWKINSFIVHLSLGKSISSDDLMNIWQNDIFRNGSQTNWNIKLSKKEIIWPIIVLVLGKQIPNEFLDDYDDALVEEIFSSYSSLINNCVERYDFISKVLYDFKQFKNKMNMKMGEQVKSFIDNKWEEYVDVLSLNSLDEELRKEISKIVIAKILKQRFTIDNIKQGAFL